MTHGTPHASLIDDPFSKPRRERRAGFSFLEVMVVLTLMGIMIAIAAPTFRRTIETATADIAIANLRAVWAAQRVYWIANRAYASDISTLVSLDLLNPEVLPSHGTYSYYTYSITSADTSTFSATAQRTSGASYVGSFQIDQNGTVAGSISDSTDPSAPAITPPQSQ